MENQKKKKSRFFPGLLLGVVFGLILAAVAPGWWQAYVPDTFFAGGSVEGVVLDKSTEDDRLLLKLETGEGVVLATFTAKLEEINLLVEKGDRVTLRVSRYEPFITDPRLQRVQKPEDAATIEPEPEAEPEKVTEEPPPGISVEEPPEEPTEEPTATTTTIPPPS